MPHLFPPDTFSAPLAEKNPPDFEHTFCVSLTKMLQHGAPYACSTPPPCKSTPLKGLLRPHKTCMEISV